MNCINKKTIFSGIQPSGTLTLGNYLGAIKNWINFQDEYNCFFSLVDLHTITVRQDPEKFKKNALEAYALFLACGIDPEKSAFFIQSHVPAHSQLAWILNCYTQFGELSRMTQFKDKSQSHAQNINAGLFCYPSLMAADILLYQSDLIPVGADQKQHVELARDIAQRFNSIYGEIFKIPEVFIPKSGARIMSLQEPTKKMSKSDKNENSYISILDNPDIIIKKIKKSVTDSNNIIKFSGENTGIDNLINIFSAITNKSVSEIESEYLSKSYGHFKLDVAESIVETLKPIQEKFVNYIKNIDYMQKHFNKAKEKAIHVSEKTLEIVMDKIGFIT